MNEAQRLWDLHRGMYISDDLDLMDTEVMTKASFYAALSDYSPFITDREPTREDGNHYGDIIIRWSPNGDGIYDCDVINYSEWAGSEWMRIPK